MPRTPLRRGKSVPMRWLPLAVILSIALASCGQPPPPLPPIEVEVDPAVAPTRDSIPGFEDGQPRPLAGAANEDGTVADFVANEVWLATDDPGVLASFLARWNGEVLLTFDPDTAGIDSLPTQYLVRVDTSAVTDPAASLADDLRRLHPRATGTHRVSSEEGLALIGLTSSEAAAGLGVGINWVGSGAGPFTDRTSMEAPTGGKLGDIDYTPD